MCFEATRTKKSPELKSEVNQTLVLGIKQIVTNYLAWEGAFSETTLPL